jgi:putative tryptophan/tyrosine transport system ATP-binding protein
MAAAMGIKISSLSVVFSNGQSSFAALTDINLEIAPQSFVVIVGPNGAGKSTLVRSLMGDCQPSSGTIFLFNNEESVDCSSIPRWKRATQIAQIHQDPKHGTIGAMTVFENLRLAVIKPHLPSLFRFDSAGRDRAWFQARLEAIGLADKLDNRVAELSQGQRQLLALNIALSRRPSILLADEHTGSLDQSNAITCLKATTHLCKQQSTTVIMVTHNLLDALRCGDRLIVMRDGRVSADLAAAEKRALKLEDLLLLCGYTN